MINEHKIMNKHILLTTLIQYAMHTHYWDKKGRDFGSPDLEAQCCHLVKRNRLWSTNTRPWLPCLCRVRVGHRHTPDSWQTRVRHESNTCLTRVNYFDSPNTVKLSLDTAQTLLRGLWVCRIEPDPITNYNSKSPISSSQLISLSLKSSIEKNTNL